MAFGIAPKELLTLTEGEPKVIPRWIFGSITQRRPHPSTII